eukprot:7422083-Pyramimonas_sp.AAC.1
MESVSLSTFALKSLHQLQRLPAVPSQSRTPRVGAARSRVVKRCAAASGTERWSSSAPEISLETYPLVVG